MPFSSRTSSAGTQRDRLGLLVVFTLVSIVTEPTMVNVAQHELNKVSTGQRPCDARQATVSDVLTHRPRNTRGRSAATTRESEAGDDAAARLLDYAIVMECTLETWWAP
jgi:hypothetical protein